MFNTKRIKALEERVDRLTITIRCMKGDHERGKAEQEGGHYVTTKRYGLTIGTIPGTPQRVVSNGLSEGYWAEKHFVVSCKHCGVELERYAQQKKEQEEQK